MAQKGKGYTTIKLKTNLNTVGTVNYQKANVSYKQ